MVTNNLLTCMVVVEVLLLPTCTLWSVGKPCYPIVFKTYLKGRNKQTRRDLPLLGYSLNALSSHCWVELVIAKYWAFNPGLPHGGMDLSI